MGNYKMGDFIGDDLSGVHTCHAECPCHADRSSASNEQGEQEARTGGVSTADMEAMMIRQQALRDHLYEEARKKLSGESAPSLPADQVTVNRAEKIARDILLHGQSRQVLVNRADLADLTDMVLSRRFAGVNGPLERLRAVLNQEDK